MLLLLLVLCLLLMFVVVLQLVLLLVLLVLLLLVEGCVLYVLQKVLPFSTPASNALASSLLQNSRSIKPLCVYVCVCVVCVSVFLFVRHETIRMKREATQASRDKQRIKHTVNAPGHQFVHDWTMTLHNARVACCECDLCVCVFYVCVCFMYVCERECGQ